MMSDQEVYVPKFVSEFWRDNKGKRQEVIITEDLALKMRNPDGTFNSQKYEDYCLRIDALTASKTYISKRPIKKMEYIYFINEVKLFFLYIYIDVRIK